jgi:arsenite methyltransferase
MNRVGRLANAVRVAVKRFLYEGVRRDRWQKPDLVLGALRLRPGMIVADLGSGAGYFTIRLARAIGPEGTVFAVDTDADLRDSVVERARGQGLGNVRAVAAGAEDPALPEPVDLIFLASVFHHLPDPPAYFRRAIAGLRPGGRVAILETRPEGLGARIFGHVTAPERVRSDMVAAGYRPTDSLEGLPRQSLQFFEPTTA